MDRITCEDYLKKNGSVHCGMIANSNLIDRMEIYGFVNACKDEDMYNDVYAGHILNGIVNKEPKHQIVLSNYIYQVTTHYRGKEITREGMAIPVFQSLVVSESEGQYNVEDLYVPSLVGKELYRKIKSRHGNGVLVREYDLEKAKFSSHIKAIEGRAILNAPKAHIHFIDKDGEVKSMAENIMVVCRYLHTETGTMCYTQYNLTEVFVDDVH